MPLLLPKIPQWMRHCCASPEQRFKTTIYLRWAETTTRLSFYTIAENVVEKDNFYSIILVEYYCFLNNDINIWKYCQGDFMLGENIKTARKRQKLTQDKLARLADIPYTTLTKIETGVIKKPSVFVIAKIAKVLNISLEALLK